MDGRFMVGKTPDCKGWSDSNGNVNEGRPFAKDEPERVSFGVPLDLAGFADMIRVGKSPFVPGGREELLFAFATGTGTAFVGIGG